MPVLAWLALGAWIAGLAGLLVVEARRSATGIAIIKPLASAGFLLMGALGGAALFLLALGLSFIGDIALVRMERPAWFRVGLYAFLAAHLVYAAAFVGAGVTWWLVLAAALALLCPGTLIARWILPHVPQSAPIVAYMVVISLMVAFAVGTRSAWLAGCALLFYASDITVARHRFVKAEPRNRLVGLPLYYAAQMGFALAAAGLA